jgi:uncharacterized membrane protein
MATIPAVRRDDEGFRLRGQDVTRLEGFVDASFAFSLTLLVIFHASLPDSVGELRLALRRVPTFAACFAMLAMFWAAHNRWSRRFGLQDAWSTVMSLALVLVVLVYVYPLRMVVSSFLALVSGGWLPSELGFDGPDRMADLQVAFIVYSLGFGLLAGLLCALNLHALRRADMLGLDAAERHLARSEAGSHALLLAAALASIVASAIILATGTRNGTWAGVPMWVHALLGVAMPAYWAWRTRSRPLGDRPT